MADTLALWLLPTLSCSGWQWGG